MNRKLAVTMIVVWSIIALFFLGLLIFFINWQHGGFGTFNWNFDWGGGSATTIVEKTVPVADIDKIDLNASSADVSFTQTQGDTIDVKIQSNRKSDKDNCSVTESGGELSITEKFKPFSDFPFFFGSFGKKILIELPESYAKDLSMNLTSGDIDFDGNYTFGDAEIKQISGDVKGDSLKTESLTMSTTSGDVRLSKIDTGNYSLHSVSGDCSVDSLSGSGSIGTTSGDLHFDLASLTGACDVRTTSGDISIGLDKSVSADVDAKATWGDVNANFPVTYSGHHEATGKVGSGPYQPLNVSVTSGDVRITAQN